MKNIIIFIFSIFTILIIFITWTEIIIKNKRGHQVSQIELLEERIKKPMNIKGLRYKKSSDINLLPTFSGEDGNLRFANPGLLIQSNLKQTLLFKQLIILHLTS